MRRSLSFAAIVASSVFALTTSLGGQSFATPQVEVGSGSATLEQETAALKPSPRFEAIGWTKAPKKIGIGSLRQIVGRHTVVVVPQTVDVTTSKKRQRQVLREVADFWGALVPGMSIRFVLKEPVEVSKDHCDDAGLAWEAAQRVAGSFDPYKRFNHLAAIVDCGIGVGVADLRAGSGRLMTNGWSADAIAHEFGHNLALIHANEIGCKDWTKPAPKVCQQREYTDFQDVMGGGGVVPLELRGLHGLWRAWLIGAQRLPAAAVSTIDLTRMGDGREAKPLAINSEIGTVFIDVGLDLPDAYGTCPQAGVEMRVATYDGRSEPAGQATLIMVTPDGQLLARADFLDSFAIPGTQKRALVTKREGDAVTLRIGPRSDTTRPEPPDLSAVPLGPVLLSDYEGTGPLTLPSAPGVLGYLVESSASRCTYRTAPGEPLEIPLYEGSNTVRITPVGTNGMPGEPIKRTVEAGWLRIDLVGDPGWLLAPERQPIRWTVPEDQPAAFRAAVTGWEIRTGWDRESLLAELPVSTRSWDPWPTVLPLLDGYSCISVTVSAVSNGKVIGESEWLDLCPSED